MRRTWLESDLVRINGVIDTDNAAIATTQAAITAANTFITN